MKRYIKLAVAMLLAVLMSAALALPSLSLTPSYTVGEAYKSSPYYEELMALELTADMRYDVLSVAFTQIGYHEGDSEADMDGLNVFGNKNFVEYNRIFGKVDNNEGNGVSYGYAWCAAYVSWCLRQSGVPKEIAVTEISCNRMTKWFEANSTFHPLSEGYVPLPGDIIMFHNGDNSADHVGLVVGVKDEKVYTVEGNSGGIVGQHLYNLTDTGILGYCVPAYTVKSGTDYSAFPLDDEASKPGEYIVTADSLNVRAGASSSHAKLGALERGERVTVTMCDGSWGRIDYNGAQGWISMSYVVSAKNMFYTVKYSVGDGKGGPTAQRKNPGESITISDVVPEQRFYTFGGWAVKLPADKADYVAGDVYTADESLTLYAIWKPEVFELSLKLDDGSVWKTVEVEFGKRVDISGLIPEKASDGENHYTFAGWAEAVPQYMREDGELTAMFNATPLTAEEKAALTTASSATEPPAEKSCGGFCGIAAAIALLVAALGAAAVIKKH